MQAKDVFITYLNTMKFLINHEIIILYLKNHHRFVKIIVIPLLLIKLMRDTIFLKGAYHNIVEILLVIDRWISIATTLLKVVILFW